MENIFVEFLPPWVETGIQPAFYDKESGTVLQQTARMYARVNMLIRMFNKLSKQTKNTVEEYINKFNELAQYVHDYFDNLDVQEEINNKLDQMAESGQLADIIADYIKLKGILAYDSVADLKNADNIVNGSFVETYGYYEKGDSGGAKYKIRNITNDDTVDESLLIEISSDPQNLLVAELVLNNEMHVRQFGVKGDGETDDTDKFNIAIENSKKLIIDSGTYIIDRFLPKENQIVVGIDKPTISLKGAIAPQVAINSGNKLDGIIFKSTTASLQWNRCGISGINNVSIENCSFIDFKHNSGSPNAWGILIDTSSNIDIKRCYFSGNSQSDIAMGLGCKNVNIDNCSGLAFYINIEPDNATNPLENIKISNCTLENLRVLENSYTGVSIKSLLVTTCSINNLYYDGGTSVFESCYINKILNASQSSVIYAGKLNLINSGNFSKNLLSDPYIDDYDNRPDATTLWKYGYMATGISANLQNVKDNDGIQLVINYDHLNTQMSIKTSSIEVTPGETYLIRYTGKSDNTQGSNFQSLNSRIDWFDENNDNLKQEFVSMFRTPAQTLSPFTSDTAILNVPEGARYLSIRLFNALNPSGSTSGKQSLFIRSVELFKYNPNKTPNTIPELEVRDSRNYSANSTPNNYYNYNYMVGDTVKFKTPSTYIGAVCTVAGYGSSATWKNYGALAS